MGNAYQRQGVNPSQVSLETYFETEAITDFMERPCSFKSPPTNSFRDRTHFSIITAKMRQKLGHPYHSSLFPIQNSTFESLIYFSKEFPRGGSKKNSDAFVAVSEKAAEYCDPLSVYSPHPTRSGQFVRASEFPEYDMLDIVYALNYDSVKKLMQPAITIHDVKAEAYASVHMIINSIMEGLPADVYGGIIEYALALTGSRPVGRLSSAKAAIGDKKKKRSMSKFPECRRFGG